MEVGGYNFFRIWQRHFTVVMSSIMALPSSEQCWLESNVQNQRGQHCENEEKIVPALPPMISFL